jgi:hypothetical protein
MSVTRSRTVRARRQAVANAHRPVGGTSGLESGGLRARAIPIAMIDLTVDDYVKTSSPVELREIGRTIKKVSGAGLNCFWLATATSSGHNSMTLRASAGIVAKEVLPDIIDRLRPEFVAHPTLLRDNHCPSKEWAQTLAADVATSGTMCGPIEAHCVATHLWPRRLVVRVGGQLRSYPPLRHAVDDGGRLRVDAVAAADIVVTDVVIVHHGIHYDGTHHAM